MKDIGSSMSEDVPSTMRLCLISSEAAHFFQQAWRCLFSRCRLLFGNIGRRAAQSWNPNLLPSSWRGGGSSGGKGFDDPK
jgi:hypothetical protein